MNPSLFKILLDPSAPQLPLPPNFYARYFADRIPDDPVTIYAADGYQWEVEMRDVNGLLCFCRGWSDVAHDVPIGFGYFLLFEVIDELNMKMVVFLPNGLEFEFPKKETEIVIIDSNVNSDDDEEVQFTSAISDRFRIPIKVVRVAGVVDHMTLKLRFKDGSVVLLNVRKENSVGYKRIIESNRIV